MDNNFLILNSFIDSIAIINKDGLIVYTNKAWKAFSNENNGNLNKTDCGINYLELCNKVTGEELQNANEAKIGILKIVNKEAAIFELEYPCHSENEKRWFILRAIPYEYDSKFFIISHINITKRKLAEEFVEEKNNQLKLINDKIHTSMYKITHDIQGPLNSIEGLINLSKDSENNLTINSYFALIEKSVVNLKTHIQDTLKISTSFTKAESIDFKMLINDLYESIKYMENFKYIKNEVHVKQDNPFYSHKAEIKSILSNLIHNSLKYYDKSKTDSFIILSVETNEQATHISIKDNGIGMNNELILKIFDATFQANKNIKSGYGIGLYLVKKSIDLLNGQIEVESEIGIGTEFKITLPNQYYLTKKSVKTN